MMSDFSKKCFVCGKEIESEKSIMNPTVKLPVCLKCKDTEQEKKAEQDALEGLADGFVCGCI